MTQLFERIHRRSRVVGPVLYIAGAGRSGSTILERILGSHPAVTTLGEVHHLWERGIVKDELCGCGVHFSECSFWVAVGERAFGGWERMDLGRVAYLRNAVDRHRRIARVLSPVQGAGFRRQVAAYGDLYLRIYDAAAEVSGARIVVDSGKHATLGAVLAQSRRLDLRVVHLVRDPSAVAYSWSKSVVRPEAQHEEDRFMAQYSTRLSSVQWGLANIETELLRMRGIRQARLRYEDLVDDPGPSLREALTRVGLGSFDPGAGGEVQLRCQHTVAGNPARFSQGTLTLRRDDAWRRSMTQKDRRVANAMTAPLRLAYGYRS